MKFVRPTGKVFKLSLLSSTRANGNSFQELRKLKMRPVDSTGRHIGKIMVNIVRTVVLPSTTAASSISIGMERIKLSIKKMTIGKPNATYGKIKV
ncbi:hypothetical protein D3C76_1616840 [compost metagenome]